MKVENDQEKWNVILGSVTVDQTGRDRIDKKRCRPSECHIIVFVS